MKTVTILGSTGVIGTLTVDVIDRLGEGYRVRALAAGFQAERLAEQVRRLRPEYVSVATEEVRNRLLALLTPEESAVQVLIGQDGLCDIADVPTDIVVSAIVGTQGLVPTWRAVRRGATVALANKETLVAAGDLVTALADSSGARLLPVDSEHSALFQCLFAGRADEVGRYWITASGGPFRNWPAEAIETARVEDALKHPTWTMGRKITIDSATLMNKGLEVIEAHHLFRAAYDNIKVVVHPESIVHSMVEFRDGSIMAQMSTHDMRLPIQYALTYPERLPGGRSVLDLVKTGRLTFEEPDLDRFPSLALAFAAGEAGGFAPCILNAANEVAVAAVLAGRLPFAAIPAVVESVLAKGYLGSPHGLEDVLACDAWARIGAESEIQRGRWGT